MLPKLYIPVSGFVVTPVVAWWRDPTPVRVVDPGETARVFTVPVADLTDPANRATAVHPLGHAGPAFLVESALVWGFTAEGDRPHPALRGLGAALGPYKAGHARPARMTR